MRTWLAGTVALALSVAAAIPAAFGDTPAGQTVPPLPAQPEANAVVQVPVPTSPALADLPQPDPTPTPTGNTLPPTGQIYPVPPFGETDVPFSAERRVDLVSKQARAEATRTLTP